MEDQLNFDAVVFDLDGVITNTAKVHASAWKEMFDEFLTDWSSRSGQPFEEFTYERDYLTYVDGKPRYKGVQSFLESRNVDIPFGDPEDGTEKETVCGLGNRKNEKFVDVLNSQGAEVFDTTVELIKDLKEHGIHVGVASSSKNCQLVLVSTGLDILFETRVDGVVSAQLGLKGKPEGDIFVKASENMGVVPKRAVVVEDAVSGVQAGVNGGFALVIGVARENNEEELRSHGADVVITDFKDIKTKDIIEWLKIRQGQ